MELEIKRVSEWGPSYGRDEYYIEQCMKFSGLSYEAIITLLNLGEKIIYKSGVDHYPDYYPMIRKREEK